MILKDDIDRRSSDQQFWGREKNGMIQFHPKQNYSGDLLQHFLSYLLIFEGVLYSDCQ